MAKEFRLPELGENIEEAKVIGVLVSEGDEVEKEQSVIEVETEKATLEVPAPRAGRIAKIHVEEGDTIGVDDVIVTFEEDGGAESSGERGKGEPEEQEPEEGEEGEAGERGAKQEKERKAPAKTEKTEKTEKAEKSEKDEKEPERRARARGEKGEKDEKKEEGEEGEEEREPSEPAPRKTPATGVREAERASGVGPDESAEESAGRRGVAAAPSTRHFAREIGVDIADVSGSGPGGRISIGDVKDHARKRAAGRATGAGIDELAGAPLPDLSKYGETEREPMSSVRRTIAQRMSLSWRTAPHVTLHAEADVTDLEGVRQRYKAQAKAAGGQLTITPILVKLCAVALGEHPRANASLDTETLQVVLKRYVHVGVAVDTERGLLVPVVRDADQKGVLDLAVELAKLGETARAGKLRPDDMAGASFTLTNLGSLGVGAFTPILNPPEVCVLGVGRARLVPEYVEGELRPRQKLPLSLSFDHRVLDGADAARFLKRLIELAEDPVLALF